MILIIANARRKGGLSGGDNIYEAFRDQWSDGRIIATQEMTDIDFNPFWLCYIYRIARACWIAITIKIGGIEFVYSASDFLMDSLPALIYKMRGCKWVAGFYLFAPKDNPIYYYSQKIAYWLIKRYADVVCVTNESMFDAFKGKKLIAVHGGVDLSKAKQSDYKAYDAVFVGRFHYTKGIEELTLIWDEVIKAKPDAVLAIIGDGDTEAQLIKDWVADNNKNAICFGFMGDERFDIYSRSKMVLYTTPPEHSHFSMGPVEAMACGCPLVAFNLEVMQYIRPAGAFYASIETVEDFADGILATLSLLNTHKDFGRYAKQWAQTWDWSKRAPSVLKQIREYLK